MLLALQAALMPQQHSKYALPCLSASNSSRPAVLAQCACTVLVIQCVNDAELVRDWLPVAVLQSCQPCPTRQVTLFEGAKQLSECVVMPGWQDDPATNLTKPCDKGYYSIGGNLTHPGGLCVACPEGDHQTGQELQQPLLSQSVTGAGTGLFWG